MGSQSVGLYNALCLLMGVIRPSEISLSRVQWAASAAQSAVCITYR